jgi:phenylpropionate dioxygenase-like ring-hydroxylating dioxygenase large terminal subunit
MLSKQENEYLCRVGKGTPMGELFRRFWLPALLSGELPESDGPPVRLRLLGEDLVGFRDSEGRVGILEARCAHKLAQLFWGRNEECGLRCAYHGWKYDVSGACVDMPNELPESRFRDKIRLTAYPTREQAGVVWVYMGPADRAPSDLPQMEWVRVPEGYQCVTKWLQRTNWAQGMEGEIDSSHTSFLHFGRGARQTGVVPRINRLVNPAAVDPVMQRARRDGAPQFTLRDTPYGYTYGARRRAEAGQFYWRVTRWLYPFYSLIPAAGGRAWVPIDDEHTWTFAYDNLADRPFNDEERAEIMTGANFPPRISRGAYQLRDGYIIDTWLPVANRENDYLIDQELKRTVNYTGIWGINEQDRAIQESMGPMVDRSREHLGTTDVPAIAARRLLINMAQGLERGIEPEILTNADAYAVRAMEMISPIDNFDDLLQVHDASQGLARV